MEDWPLQCFYWGGRYFGEIKLVFGTISSPNLYNNLAEIVKEGASMEAEIDKRQVGQQLDDVVAAAPKWTGEVQEFTQKYKGLCSDVGIRLAPCNDPDKAFEMQSRGVVLGLDYDLEAWTMGIPLEKWTRLVREIGEMRKEVMVTGEALKRVVGKIEYYRVCFSDGMWYRKGLYDLQPEYKPLERVVLTEEAKQCLDFWLVRFYEAKGAEVPIPDLRITFPAAPMVVWADAAGASEAGEWKGAGAYVPGGFWVCKKWTERVIEVLGKKLSALEGLAALMVCIIVISR